MDDDILVPFTQRTLKDDGWGDGWGIQFSVQFSVDISHQQMKLST